MAVKELASVTTISSTTAGKLMTVWPVIVRKGSHTFSDEPSNEAVLVGSTASGYPVLNKLFTFDPRTFGFTLRSVVDADKITIMDFYEDNKEVPFFWTNPQNDVTYEVAFVRPPRPRMDGRKDLWRLDIELRQTSPETS